MRMYGGEIERLPRRKVLIRARMKSGGPPMDICIRDVSSRGLLVQASTPPLRGTFVEVLCEGLPVVGQVIWAKDRRFGITTRERIDINRLVDRLSGFPDPGASAPDADGAAATAAMVAAGKLGHRPRSHDDSRQTSSALQFAAVTLACSGAALGIAFVLHDTLTQLFRSVTSQL